MYHLYLWLLFPEKAVVAEDKQHFNEDYKKLEEAKKDVGTWDANGCHGMPMDAMDAMEKNHRGWGYVPHQEIFQW